MPRRHGACVWALATLVLTAPACASARPADVTLVTLSAEQEAYNGRVVVTEGVVVAVRDAPDEEPYYVLQDDAQNRVLLVPSVWPADHEGEVVSVTGVFQIDPNSGRKLVIRRIDAR